MSFSQVMDEMIPIKPTYEFEGPTRPVTPSNDNPSRNPYLYHSESVAKALNQLSRDLSGMCDSNTLVAARDDDIPLLNNANNERPAASQQISCHLQVPETPGVPRSPAPAQATHVATSPTTTTIPSAVRSRSLLSFDGNRMRLTLLNLCRLKAASHPSGNLSNNLSTSTQLRVFTRLLILWSSVPSRLRPIRYRP